MQKQKHGGWIYLRELIKGTTEENAYKINLLRSKGYTYTGLSGDGSTAYIYRGTALEEQHLEVNDLEDLEEHISDLIFVF